MGGDLSEAEPGSDQLVLGVGVDAVKTGVGDRRRTDPHVHFEGPGIAQGLHQLATGGAAHDRIVDHHHPLARQHIGQGVEFYPDTRLAHRLGGLDEGATHVAVLDQAIAEGDATRLGITDSSRNAGIGHTDDNVGRHRRFPGQGLADPHPVAVEGFAEEAAVGSGEIDHLEDAELGLLHAPAAALRQGITRSEMDDLAWFHVSVKNSADDVETTGLTADNPLGISQIADVTKHQGADAVTIAQGE